MRVRSNPFVPIGLGIVAAVAVIAVQGQGLWSLGRSLADLSNADREAMKRARLEVLDKMQAGTVSAWSDASTGHSGEVNLQRVYQKNGMPCGDVEYVLKIPQASRYKAAFCRGSDGMWRADM
jgi:surface antigen